MGVSLQGTRSYFNANWATYSALMATGYECGWQPMGTVLDWCPYCPDCGGHSDGNWDGDYSSNEGQFVTDEDARELAKALRRSFDDAVRLPLAARCLLHWDSKTGGSKEFVSRQDVESFVTPFAEFCEEGGFYIY